MLSIRAKLTLWYLGIAATVIIAFSIAIYLYLSSGLLKVIDNSLWHQADRIAQGIENRYREEDSTRPDALMFAPGFASIVGRDLQVTDYLRREAPIVPESIERAAKDWVPQFDEVSISSSERARVITWPARDEDGEVFVIVGQSLKELQQAQTRLLILLAISNPVALLLAGLGGFWIANKALEPVDRVTRAAERIGRGNLSERVREPQSKDEIGRLAATFNEMIAKLEQAFQRERQFTAYASHELKTPLAILRGDIEVALRRERTAGEYQRVLASSLEEIERLTRLTEDLLTLARSDAGEQVLEFSPVRLDQLAEDASAYIKPLADSIGVTIDCDAPPQPIVIEGDYKRLKQLLVNLLDNAIKYTPQGGKARLALSTEDSRAVIEVSDTGRGIPADALPHIFERFYRHSDPRDTRASGFGLGLAISKWVVDSHGGSMEVESAEGRGSRFTVRLPVARATRSAHAQ